MNTDRKLIGEGKIAKVYLESNTVFKVFPDNYTLSWIEYEAQVQQEIYNNTKLFVPKTSYLKGSREISMDYIEGYTLADRMRKEKYKPALDDLIDLQLSTHTYHGLNLSNAHDVFESELKTNFLSDDLQEKALRALSKIPRMDTLCHFDLHFLNIIYNKENYYIIDWVNAKLGNPLLDIARTYIILKQYTPRLSNKYLKAIIGKSSFSIEDINDAITVMAALRIKETDSSSFNDTLIQLIK